MSRESDRLPLVATEMDDRHCMTCEDLQGWGLSTDAIRGVQAKQGETDCLSADQEDTWSLPAREHCVARHSATQPNKRICYRVRAVPPRQHHYALQELAPEVHLRKPSSKFAE